MRYTSRFSLPVILLIAVFAAGCYGPYAANIMDMALDAGPIAGKAFSSLWSSSDNADAVVVAFDEVAPSQAIKEDFSQKVERNFGVPVREDSLNYLSTEDFSRASQEMRLHAVLVEKEDAKYLVVFGYSKNPKTLQTELMRKEGNDAGGYKQLQSLVTGLYPSEDQVGYGELEDFDITPPSTPTLASSHEE